MRIVRGILIALLLSLLVGLFIGTALRLHMERPEVYIGSALAPLPLDVGHAGAGVLDPSHHEQKVG